MNEFLFLAVGFLVGVIFTKYWSKPSTALGDRVLLNPEQVRQKEENLQKIMEYLASHDQVSNDEAERMLGVSNNTAERYLDELEKQGKLIQVGRTGRSVIYRKP